MDSVISVLRRTVYHIVSVVTLLLCLSGHLQAAQQSADDAAIIDKNNTSSRNIIDRAWEATNRALPFEAAIILQKLPVGWQPVSDRNDKSYWPDQFRAGDLAFMRWDLASAEKLYAQLRIEAEAKQGRASQDYFQATLRLALNYVLKQETTQVEELTTQAAGLLDSAYPQESKAKFLALSQLAASYNAAGKKNHASDIFTKAFALAKKISATPVEYAKAILELNPYYYAYSLEPAQAAALMQELRDVVKSALGENSAEFANVLRISATITRGYAASSEVQELYKKGKYQEVQPLLAKKNALAQEFLQQAIQIYEKQVPQQAGEYIEALKDLSMLYYRGTDQTNKNKSVQLVDKALLVSQNAYNENDVELLNWKAQLHAYASNRTEQLTILSESEAIARKVYGTRNIYYSIIVQQLGSTSLGKYYQTRNDADMQAALRYFDLWLQVTKDIYGDKSNSCASVLNNLAGIYAAFDKTKAAEFASQAENILKKK